MNHHGDDKTLPARLPARLIDGDHAPGSREDVVAAHLRSATAVPDLNPAALSRLWTRIAPRTREGRGWARAHSWLRWRTATVVGVVALSIGGVTAAAVWVVAPRVRARGAAPAHGEVDRATPAPHRPGTGTRAAIEETAPTPELMVADPESAAPAAPAAPAATLDFLAAGPAPERSAQAPAPAPRPNARLLARAEPQGRAPHEPELAQPAEGPAAPEAAPSPALLLPETRSPTLEPPAFIPSSLPSASRSAPPAVSAGLPPATSAPAAGSAQPARPRVSPSRATAATPATRLALETELLSLALGRLRRDHDPLSALELLDQHASRFPRGTLMPEAEVTRVDALLALDRREEAAKVLGRLALPASARGRELLVVRGELAAGARRWTAAIGDFTRALADPALESELFERALHGRAACHLATRNLTAARGDLDAYLRRFPSGRFAATTSATVRDLESSAR